MKDTEYIEFEDCKLVRQTEKAALIRFDDGEERWIPWSQISEDGDLSKDGDMGTVYLTEWICKQKEIEY